MTAVEIDEAAAVAVAVVVDGVVFATSCEAPSVQGTGRQFEDTKNMMEVTWATR